jgi:hypothetical protein
MVPRVRIPPSPPDRNWNFFQRSKIMKEEEKPVKGFLIASRRRYNLDPTRDWNSVISPSTPEFMELFAIGSKNNLPVRADKLF